MGVHGILPSAARGVGYPLIIINMEQDIYESAWYLTLLMISSCTYTLKLLDTGRSTLEYPTTMCAKRHHQNVSTKNMNFFKIILS